MASQVSPGIILKERDLSNAVIVGASQIKAATASTFQKGPIGQVVDVSSQKDLLSIFGAPVESNAEDWFVASEFLNYGGRLAVVRAATGVNSASAAGGAVLVQNDDDWNAGTGNANLFVARTAGTWGNSIKVVAVDRGADQILTLASAPATTALNTAFTTTSGVQGRIYSWDAAAKELAVILDNPSTLIAPGDNFDEPGDGVATTVTAGAYAGQGSQVGTYTTDLPNTQGTGTGLRLQIIIDAGGNITLSLIHI
mgnify:CR=1 FL=1